MSSVQLPLKREQNIGCKMDIIFCWNHRGHNQDLYVYVIMLGF